jgi:DNA polymerase
MVPRMAVDPLERLHTDYAADPAFSRLRERTKLVPGAGARWFPRVLFLGEAPGAQEEWRGEPFVGDSGQLLDAMLRGIGLPRGDCWITNAIKYRPPNNRTPSAVELSAARLYVRREISILRPDVVATLGRCALIGLGWDGQSVSAIHGRPFMIMRRDIRTGKPVPSRLPPVVPLYHPAAVLRGLQTRADYAKDFLCLKYMAS